MIPIKLVKLLSNRVVFLLTVFFVLTTSCNQRESSWYQSYCKNLYGNKIILPENLESIPPTSSLASDSQYNIKGNQRSKKKIVFWQNGSCSSCRLQLEYWRILQQQSPFDEVEIICFLFFEEEKDVDKMKSLLHDSGIIYYVDLENQFITSNNILNDSNLSCFLVNSENEVQIIGNPLSSDKIKKLYTRNMD